MGRYFNSTPDTETDPWSPFEVFQVRLEPEQLHKTVKRKWSVAGLKRKRVRSYDTIRNDMDVRRTGPYSIKVFDRREVARKKYWSSIISDYESSYAGSRNRIAYLSHLRSIPDVFTIVVGVVDKSAYHKGADMATRKGFTAKGHDISYEELFEALFNVSDYNFDPLINLRSESSHQKIESKIGSIVDSVISSANPSKIAIETLLKKYAASIRDQARDYIKGCDRPPLSDATVRYYRECKKDNDDSLYRYGIDKPLIESEQLLFAIDYDVIVEQSDSMRKFVDFEIRNSEAVKKYESAQASAKINKSVVALEKSAAKKLLSAVASGDAERAQRLLLHAEEIRNAEENALHKEAIQRMAAMRNREIAMFRSLYERAKLTKASFKKKFRTSNEERWSSSARIKMAELRREIKRQSIIYQTAVEWLKNKGIPIS